MILAVLRMGHEAKSEGPLRVEVYGGDKAVVVA